MVTALKGIKPEIVVPSKPKILISGPAGTWKSSFCLHAEKPFYIDTESGIVREQYMEKLIASGGSYFGPQQGSQDFAEITAQVKALATEKHDFKVVVVDSLTKPFRLDMFAAEDRGVSSEFKKSQKEAEKSARKMLSWLMRPDLDLTVIMVCHSKDKWTKEGTQLIKEDTIWDGPEKLDYDLDLWLETKMIGKEVQARIKKSRVKGFEMGMIIPFDFATFKKMYGAAVIDRPVKPIVLASEDQVKEIKRLITLLSIPQEDFDKWLTKAQATEPEDLSAENADKMLKFLETKIKGETK